MDQVKRICMGKITGAHGVRGDVRVRSFTEYPEDLFDYAPITDESGTRLFEMTPKGVIKDDFIVEITGLSDRDEALALRGTKLFVSRDALPQTGASEYYVADLIGLEVHEASTGKVLGKVTESHDYGGGVFLEVKPPEAASFMLPFRDAFVPEVHVAEGYLTAIVPTETEAEADEDKGPATP